ncbi:DUF6708 domain-containing protein [Achromobacter aloeverae]|uniref:DUF6708 domain-containing protein n=1 Tax=Achromobacter aloeverae TaxID=1750518 RepID=A0A4Q1HI19_9BURK|nr:DUF6708 domain-containing protein [Achromobacter aloeverae]RXN86237.1 hypothetical protein C7R54_21170 [Achromobacter aloeverae]
MDNTGIYPKFPNNRPLTQWERDKQLKQKQRLEVAPRSELAVVKLNSTYLLSVDRWYRQRGFLTLLGLAIAGVGLYWVVDFLWMVATGKVPNENGLWPVIFVGCGVLAIIAVLGLSMAGKELFRWTYYPIALDRKHRMVHVFRLNGTVLSVPWDEVFFTLGRGKGIFGALNWDLRGLVLDKDRKTVRETFAFSIVIDQEKAVIAHWEFLRRYMEEGPAAVIDAIRFCMPVDGQREPAAAGRERIFVNDAGMSGAMWLIMWPFNTLHAWARMLAMRTSRIPRWPADIAATLTVAKDDPYVRDASMNPPDLR